MLLNFISGSYGMILLFFVFFLPAEFYSAGVARLEICSNFAPEFQRKRMVKNIIGILAAAVALLFCAKASAQDKGYDVFNPIAKYISQGEAEKLSAWFSDNLEVTRRSRS